MRSRLQKAVIPAQPVPEGVIGERESRTAQFSNADWIPASAGMTVFGPFYRVSPNSSRPISQRRISDVPAPIS
jgi:hypothetical protein